MAITIKNPEVERLAREAARLDGVSLTEAVLRALELRMTAIQGKRRAPTLKETLLDIGNRCASLPDIDTRPPEAILGYGEEGFLHHGR